MNIMHLRYALAIEETGSVTRAAEQMFVAQPNISRAIRELEASVGTALFRRTPVGMEATEEGKAFLGHARHIVQEIDNLKSTYDSSGRFQRYFSACSHGGRYAAVAFAEFAAGRGVEGFSYTFKEIGSAAVISQVIQGLYGIGIIRFPLHAEAQIRQHMAAHELNMEVLFEAPLLYTASARSHLALVKTVSAKDAEKLTEISGEAIYMQETDKASERRIRLYDRGSRILTLQTAPDTFMLSVEEDTAFLKENGLVQRPGAGTPMLVEDAVIFRKKHVRTKQDKVFLEILREKASLYKK